MLRQVRPGYFMLSGSDILFLSVYVTFCHIRSL